MTHSNFSQSHIIAVSIAVFAGLLTSLSAQAGPGYQIEMQVTYSGRTYEVPKTAIPAGERVMLATSPASDLKVYVRAISLPGLADQVLLETQTYIKRNGADAQLSATTMPAYLDAPNSNEAETVYGKVGVRAFLSANGSPVAPGQTYTTPAGETKLAPIQTGGSMIDSAGPSPRPVPVD